MVSILQFLRVINLIVGASTEKLAAEPVGQRQQIIDLVLPYVVLPFRVSVADFTLDTWQLIFRIVSIGARTSKPLRHTIVATARAALPPLSHDRSWSVPFVP